MASVLRVEPAQIEAEYGGVQELARHVHRSIAAAQSAEAHT